MAYGSSSVLTVAFTGSDSGAWQVMRQTALQGPAIDDAPYVDVAVGDQIDPASQAHWRLRGVVSHLRYTIRQEAAELGARQASLARAEAVRAALIPIRKSPAWWALPQDERRAIYEERSRHTTIGMEYLPQIARRLHHSRDLGEPFDFLTWFEFAPKHETLFEELLARLRASEEWRYVEREIDIRLTRAA
jgi:chlorite dismutase